MGLILKDGKFVDARKNWMLVRCSGSILDIGTGNGHIFRDSGLDVTALDINELKPSEFPQVVADAHALPFKDNSFDYCVLGEILEHVHNPILVMREAARVARKRVVLTVPDEYHWPAELKPFQTLDSRLEEKEGSLNQVLKEAYPALSKLRDLTQVFHNRWYTREMLESQLKYVGLPYQIEIVKGSVQTGDMGWSHICAVISKENHA